VGKVGETGQKTHWARLLLESLWQRAVIAGFVSLSLLGTLFARELKRLRGDLRPLACRFAARGVPSTRGRRA
jgi:hypothetical protein